MFAAIAEWAADTRANPGRARRRHDRLAGGFQVPTETTIRRTLGQLDSHALAAAVGDWLVARDRHDHPGPRSGHGSGRWPSTARRCAGCLLSQPVTRPAQALVTAVLWGREAPPAFRARRG